MSPLSHLWSSHGRSTTRTPVEDSQLRTHATRESDMTPTPSLDTRTSSTPTLAPPRAHQSLRQLNDEALSDFFGGQGHRARSQRRSLPPYAVEWERKKLPDPSSDFEVETVARHLFKYGFFFPVFWAIGIYFLFVPMRVSEDWHSDRTREEREKLLSEMRATEVKWAKRCLWALLTFVLCIVILIVAVVLSRH